MQESSSLCQTQCLARWAKGCCSVFKGFYSEDALMKHGMTQELPGHGKCNHETKQMLLFKYIYIIYINMYKTKYIYIYIYYIYNLYIPRARISKIHDRLSSRSLVMSVLARWRDNVATQSLYVMTPEGSLQNRKKCMTN